MSEKKQGREIYNKLIGLAVMAAMTAGSSDLVQGFWADAQPLMREKLEAADDDDDDATVDHEELSDQQIANIFSAGEARKPPVQ